MKPLTKAEEQVMQQVWKLSSAYLKDIVESYPMPRPHTNTVATLVKILVDKGYIGVEAMGRVHRYFPLVSKEAYSTNSRCQLRHERSRKSPNPSAHLIQTIQIPPTNPWFSTPPLGLPSREPESPTNARSWPRSGRPPR